MIMARFNSFALCTILLLSIVKMASASIELYDNESDFFLNAIITSTETFNEFEASTHFPNEVYIDDVLYFSPLSTNWNGDRVGGLFDICFVSNNIATDYLSFGPARCSKALGFYIRPGQNPPEIKVEEINGSVSYYDVEPDFGWPYNVQYFGFLSDVGIRQITLEMPSGSSFSNWYYDNVSHGLIQSFTIEVQIDIKPRTCPNECHIKGGGSVKVAILGTVDFDVTDIDIASVRLEGIAPVRSSLKDKSSPVVPPPTECECTTEGRDGFIDLCLKFDKKAIISALGEVNVDQEYVLTLSGELNDGTPIEGQDCIVFVKKGKKD